MPNIKKVYKINLDVSKLSKDRLFKGEKGTYANLDVVVRDGKDEYDNYGFISESTTKEEREQGVQGNIVGNVRFVNTVGNGSGSGQNGPSNDLNGPVDIEDVSDELPF